MENSFFLYSETDNSITATKVHICTWEFKDGQAMIEFGVEICPDSISSEKKLNMTVYVPWLDDTCTVNDLYSNLQQPKNCKFIFNERIISSHTFDGGAGTDGVIHSFSDGRCLALLPVKLEQTEKKIEIEIDLTQYHKFTHIPKKNPYFRLMIECKSNKLIQKKSGISKSSIIYDVKLNELRNLSDEIAIDIKNKNICVVSSCYYFNIIPNKHTASLTDLSLKAIRSLEFEAFQKYLTGERLKSRDLIVLFYKKKAEAGVGYSFFSIYNDEIIGSNQIALAFFANIICGILLFIPAYRRTFNPVLAPLDFFKNVPVELKFIFTLVVLFSLYIIWKIIRSTFANFKKVKKT